MAGEGAEQLQQRVIAMFDERLARVESAQDRLAEAMERQASATEKLAVLWSKHEEQKDAIGRAFQRVDDVEEDAITRHQDHETRLRNIEGEMPTMKLTRGWVISFTLAGTGLLCLAVAGLVLIK